MRIAIFTVVAFGALFLLYDQRPLHMIIESIRHGSVAGVEACVASKQSEMHDPIAVRKSCTAKHEHELPTGPWNIDGRAKISEMLINGTVENKLVGYVVTGFTMTVIDYDAIGETTEFLADADTWALPSNEAEFDAKYRRDSRPTTLSKDWCSHDNPKDELELCKSWDITAVYGVSY